MTTMLSLACTCKTFNSIINEQQHHLKNTNRIVVDFSDFRDDRCVVVNVKRRLNDSMDLIERYFHGSRVPVDIKLEYVNSLIFLL
ncbi:hypothetical protein KIN20_016889 [Parelaphostrongylus tenuis]|uniref:F-box domain-containing protein n=1 Tax=Parelaphostrongylus tenuis TaxID=148309 RepID=A0AAD5MHY3_PARTN|nr:hypothetical protein KIN20_016889 [Parelaphostrongylus tenuis]